MENPIDYEENLNEADVLNEEIEDFVPVRKKMKPGVIMILVVAAVVVLGGAAYLGGRLLTGQTANGIRGGSMMLTSNNGGTTSVKSLDLERSPDLPQEKVTTAGILDHMEDNTLFLGTGKMMAMGDSEGNLTMSYDGPVVEVVVNHDTEIFKDVTDFGLFDAEGPVQQVVEPGSVDEIQKNTIVTVWGEKQGDRVIAKTLVYQSSGLGSPARR
jgi:hypothetical protein